MEPLHDSYSHGADAMRYVATWVPQMTSSAVQDYTEPDAPDWRM
jgi:phage terminase large subunit